MPFGPLPHWIRNLALAVIGLALLGGGPSPADAISASLAPSNSRTISFSYDVSLGAMRVLTLDGTARLGKDDYEIASAARTRGLADAIFNVTTEASASGFIRGGTVEPLSYHYNFKGRFRADHRVRMSYGADGSPLTQILPEDVDEDREPVPPNDRRDTLDPLSAAILGSIAAEPGDPCSGKFPIFDGRRRYDLGFVAVEGDSILRPDGKVETGGAQAAEADAAVPGAPDWLTGAGEGEAICRIVTERISGFEKEFLERQPDGPPPVDMLVSSFADGTLRMPLVIASQSSWGTFTARLVRLAIDGVPVGGHVAAVND